MKYEGSPADRKADAKGAKKAGMTAAQWERSAADKRADKAGQRKMDKRPRDT